MKNNYLVIGVFLLSVIIIGCKSKSWDEDVSNLNKGEIIIYADESYTTLVEELIKSYENVYPEAKIKATFASDQEIFEAMIGNKTQMIVTGRKLTELELKAIEQAQKINPEQFIIATEAIAVVASSSNTDSVFDMNEFIKSRTPGYTGKYLNTNFVFNKSNGSMIQQLLVSEGASTMNLFSLDNKDTLVSYVAANQNTYGFISFAEISDMDDPAAQSLLKGIQVLQVASTSPEGNVVTVPLSQSSLATGKYPLQRHVTVVRGNIAEMLGTGFVNFMYRTKASRIILKAGLIPTKMPEREIKIVD